MPSDTAPRVWALLGPHRGDNNQVLALAQALGFPFDEKKLSYNALRRIPPALLGATIRSVEASARAQLEGEPPDLTISTGLRSVPVVRELRRRSGGRTRSVHLGFPRISPRYFDLVVPTPEYPVPDAPNVMRIPFALTPHAAVRQRRDDEASLKDFPHPRRLVLIGGPTLYWKLAEEQVVAAVRRLMDKAAAEGGSVLAIGSPRTPRDLLRAIGPLFQSTSVPALLVPSEGSPTYSALVAAADEIFVTADSVAMVADAVTTGKPVGLIPIEKSALGSMVMASMDRLRPGRRLYPRDLRFFWRALEEQGYAGTLDAPRAISPPDYLELVADRVRLLFEQPRPPATGARGSDR